MARGERHLFLFQGRLGDEYLYLQAKNFSEKERCGTLEQSMWELRCVQAYIMQSLTLEYGYLRATIMAKVSEIIHAVSKHNTRDITRLCKASDRGQ